MLGRGPAMSAKVSKSGPSAARPEPAQAGIMKCLACSEWQRGTHHVSCYVLNCIAASRAPSRHLLRAPQPSTLGLNLIPGARVADTCLVSRHASSRVPKTSIASGAVPVLPCSAVVAATAMRAGGAGGCAIPLASCSSRPRSSGVARGAAPMAPKRGGGLFGASKQQRHVAGHGHEIKAAAQMALARRRTGESTPACLPVARTRGSALSISATTSG